MSPVPQHSIAAAVSRAVTTTLILAVAACSSAEKRVDTTSAATTTSARPAAMPSDTMAGKAGMQGMTATTGDPDHDFLRMMSDHHQGLIALAHMAKDRGDAGVAAIAAKKLDASQDAELDKMMTMLEKHYKDPYAPKVMAEHQAMADELKTKSGKEYDRTFLQDAIKHHEEALRMIDAYLPKSTKPGLKGMAEQMKTDQSRQIELLKGQLAKVGA